MYSIRSQDSTERPGWILGCNESHWTMHVVTTVAGEDSSRRASGEPGVLFPWFDPDLQPEEAFQQLTGTDTGRNVTPRNHQAVIAFTTRTSTGQFRMEFTAEGIPVLVRSPGESGFRFWGDVSRASRPIRSGEEPMNWPACSAAQQRPSEREPQPCWFDSGNAQGDSGCLRLLEWLTDTSEFKTAGCSF